MADIRQNVTRASIGKFFTIKAKSGFIFSNSKKEIFEQGDLITSFFDTNLGIEPELDPFFGSGIKNGVAFKCLKLPAEKKLEIPRDGEKLKTIVKNAVKENPDGTAGYETLVDRPDILVLALRMKDGREEGRVYYIMTQDGIFTGSLSNMPASVLKGYDRNMATALPYGVSETEAPRAKAAPQAAGSVAESMLKEAQDTAEDNIRYLRDQLQSMRTSVQVLEGRCDGSDKKIREIAAQKQAARDEWEPRVKSAADALDAARKAKAAAELEQQQTQEALAGLGLLAFGKRKMLRESLEAMTGRLSGLEKAVADAKKAHENTRNEMSKALDRLSGTETELRNDVDRLEEQRKAVSELESRLQSADDLLKRLKEGRWNGMPVRKLRPEPPKPQKRSVDLKSKIFLMLGDGSRMTAEELAAEIGDVSAYAVKSALRAMILSGDMITDGNRYWLA